MSAATALALAAAVVGFVVIAPAGEDAGIPRDGYTVAADHLCLTAKRQIVATERKALAGRGARGGRALEGLVPVVAGWRKRFEAMPVPTDRTGQARALSEALREVEIQLSDLVLASGDTSPRATLDAAKKVDAASSEVESAAAALNLSECSARRIELGGPGSS